MDAVLAALGWDEVMPAYHDEVLGPFHPQVGPTVFHARLAAALAAAAVRRAGAPVRLLDAGCGPGNLLEVLAAQHVPVEVVGVDLSVVALGIAERRAAELGVDATFIAADLSELALGREFDVVVSVNSLLPVRERPDVRAAVVRTLRCLGAHLAPEGALLLLVPAFDAVIAEAEARARAAGGDLAFARRRVGREMLLDVEHRLADNGFNVAHCLHDPATLEVELPAAGLTTTAGPLRLDYPPSAALRVTRCGACWDWLVEASRQPS